MMNYKTVAKILFLTAFLAATAFAQPVDDARRVAELHYAAAAEGLREEWVEYFAEKPREEFKALIAKRSHGCDLELVWLASQRSYERGISYKYLSGEKVSEDKIKLIFQPRLRSGSKTSATVPVFLEREGGQWKITNLRYH